MTTSVSEPHPVSQPVTLTWARSELATFWLLHPSAADFDEHPPCRHRADGSINPLQLLEAAVQADVQLAAPGPAFFVVPELTIAGDKIDELRRITNGLGANRVAIVGLGHLTQTQCDELEAGVGSDASLWRREWGVGRYANAAAVCVGGHMWLEAKDWPSKFEDEGACHLAHRRIRVFRGQNTSFAVLICSEFLPSWSPDAFLRTLANERVDTVFWIQHNPSPRHDSFRRGLGALYDTQGDNTLLVAVNKQPFPGKRAPYGASAMYAPSTCFPRRKENLLRPNFVTEPLQRGSGVSRAVFVRYDVPAHQVLTIHPAGVPRDAAPGGFLREVVPYTFSSGKLAPDDVPRHFHDLFRVGRTAARVEAGLDGWLGCAQLEATTQLAQRLNDVETDWAANANALMNFLDTALLQSEDDGTHPNQESHVLAGDCDCWSHRENFDSLFQPQTAAAVGELALAVAAMRSCAQRVDIELSARSPANLKLVLADTTRSVLLASSLFRLDEVKRRLYPKGRTVTQLPAMIILRSERGTTLPANAAQVDALGAVSAATVQLPDYPTLVGSEFWGAFRTGHLAQMMNAIATGVR